MIKKKDAIKNELTKSPLSGYIFFAQILAYIKNLL